METRRYVTNDAGEGRKQKEGFKALAVEWCPGEEDSLSPPSKHIPCEAGEPLTGDH